LRLQQALGSNGLCDDGRRASIYASRRLLSKEDRANRGVMRSSIVRAVLKQRDTAPSKVLLASPQSAQDLELGPPAAHPHDRVFIDAEKVVTFP
jgi:hypothetical protein